MTSERFERMVGYLVEDLEADRRPMVQALVLGSVKPEIAAEAVRRLDQAT